MPNLLVSAYMIRGKAAELIQTKNYLLEHIKDKASNIMVDSRGKLSSYCLNPKASCMFRDGVNGQIPQDSDPELYNLAKLFMECRGPNGSEQKHKAGNGAGQAHTAGNGAGQKRKADNGATRKFCPLFDLLDDGDMRRDEIHTNGVH